MKSTRMKKAITCLMLATIVAASLLLPACSRTESESKQFTTLDDLKNCTFALSDSNSSYISNIEKELPGVQFDMYTN